MIWTSAFSGTRKQVEESIKALPFPEGIGDKGSVRQYAISCLPDTAELLLKVTLTCNRIEAKASGQSASSVSVYVELPR